MIYVCPIVLSCRSVVSTIQNGTGATALGLPKNNHLPEDPSGHDPTLMLSTTGAYEADE